MLKRTKGRLLITLLVTTGLAGTLNNSTLSQKERKQAITLIKSSRNEIVNSVNGLSDQQINYKPSMKDPSIGELIFHMVSLEKACSEEIKEIMMQPANSENRLKMTLTDEQLLANNDAGLCKIEKLGKPETSPTRASTADAIKKFIALRNNHIKYIRTSTEDLRNHVVNTRDGWIDCYQYYLLQADRSRYIAGMIGKIKLSPHFPEK